MVVRLSLIEQLPEGQRSEQHLEESLRSPQFRQSLGINTHQTSSLLIQYDHTRKNLSYLSER